MDTSDVVVVGAGIGGAVLALALGSRGWSVKLLEREREPPRMIRPEILWGATPAALDQYGVGETIRSTASVRLGGIEAWSGSRKLLGLSKEDLQAAGAAAYSTDPNLTRQAIADAAAATGNVTVMRDVDVQEVLREGGRIVGVQAIHDGVRMTERCRLVVGDDGTHSIVRAALSTGPTMKLKLFPLDFLTAAISWPSSLPPDQGRVWLNPQALRSGIPALGCLPWPGGRGVILLPLPHQRAEAVLHSASDAIWSELTKLTPLAGSLRAHLKFPPDFRHVRRPYRHAPRYVADGAAIIGDAAHPVSPAGGQGANAAVWDALALAEVADDALQAGDTSPNRLARYEAMRWPRNRASVAITERAAMAFSCSAYVPGLSWIAPLALRRLDRLPRLKARFISTVANTFVTKPTASEE